MEIWQQFGISGVIIGALAAYIIRIEKRHAKERKEWMEIEERERKESRDMHKQHFDRLGQISDDSGKVLRENTSVIAALNKLIETLRK